MVRDRDKPFDFTLPPQFSASRARVVTYEEEAESFSHPEARPKDPQKGDSSLPLRMTEEKPKTRSRTSLELEKETVEKIKNVQTKEELGDLTIEYLSSIFERTAILLITKTHIVGWCGEGSSFGKNIKNVNISLELESVFKYVVNKKNHYCGLWNPTRGDHLFYESLEATRSDDIIAVPVISNNKVFAIFYADNYKVNPHHITSSDTEIEGLKHIAKEFSDAFFQVMKK